LGAPVNLSGTISQKTNYSLLPRSSVMNASPLNSLVNCYVYLISGEGSGPGAGAIPGIICSTTGTVYIYCSIGGLISLPTTRSVSLSITTPAFPLLPLPPPPPLQSISGCDFSLLSSRGMEVYASIELPESLGLITSSCIPPITSLTTGTIASFPSNFISVSVFPPQDGCNGAGYTAIVSSTTFPTSTIVTSVFVILASLSGAFPLFY